MSLLFEGKCTFLSAEVTPSADEMCPECGRSGPISETTKCPHFHSVAWHSAQFQHVEQQQQQQLSKDDSSQENQQ